MMKGVSEISQPNRQHPKGVSTMAQAVCKTPIKPFSPSLKDFCRLVEECSQQTDDPRVLAALCESQAEALRITREDASVEAIDLLLDTMLNTLQHLAEAREQKRWPNRMKAALSELTFKVPKAREVTKVTKVQSLKWEGSPGSNF
jgi:hypothetical protein